MSLGRNILKVVFVAKKISVEKFSLLRKPKPKEHKLRVFPKGYCLFFLNEVF